MQAHKTNSKPLAWIKVNLHQDLSTEIDYSGFGNNLVIAMGNAILNDKAFEEVIMKAVEVVKRKREKEAKKE